MSFVLLLDVPDAKSFCSTRQHFNPRALASNTTPVPVCTPETKADEQPSINTLIITRDTHTRPYRCQHANTSCSSTLVTSSIDQSINRSIDPRRSIPTRSASSNDKNIKRLLLHSANHFLSGGWQVRGPPGGPRGRRGPYCRGHIVLRALRYFAAVVTPVKEAPSCCCGGPQCQRCVGETPGE